MFKGMRERFFSSHNKIEESPPCPDDHSFEQLPETAPPSTLIHSENLALYTEVLASFKQAEQFIKSVELDSNGNDLSVPSINELRYTGHHIVKAIQSDDPEKQKEELKKAFRHCKRASFDAVELGIIGKLEIITLFEHDYRNSIIQDVWPDYLDSAAELEKIQYFLKHQNITRSRENYFDSCLTHYEKVAEISQKTRLARPQLNRQRNKARTRVFLSVVLFTLTAIYGVLLLAVEEPIQKVLQKQPWAQEISNAITREEPKTDLKTKTPLDTQVNPKTSKAPPIAE